MVRDVVIRRLYILLRDQRNSIVVIIPTGGMTEQDIIRIGMALIAVSIVRICVMIGVMKVSASNGWKCVHTGPAVAKRMLIQRKRLLYNSLFRFHATDLEMHTNIHFKSPRLEGFSVMYKI